MQNVMPLNSNPLLLHSFYLLLPNIPKPQRVCYKPLTSRAVPSSSLIFNAVARDSKPASAGSAGDERMERAGGSISASVGGGDGVFGFWGVVMMG